mmetsp:Transcript_64306/g.102395  ORF Transcript_64306/g.102395 Transcript_64306/m.102395 type:complete len:592 (-) Transcript_64306:80-1855(-)
MGQVCDCSPLPKDDKQENLLQQASKSATTRGRTANSNIDAAEMALPVINPVSLSKYAKAVIKCDLSHLTKNQQQALLKLRQATQLMDEIFMYQSSGMSMSEWTEKVETEYKNNEATKDFMNGISKQDYLRFLTVNMGPWDRLSDTVHEQKENPKPKGANFYPLDMTADEFNKYVESLKTDEEKTEAKSFFTLIVRGDDGELKYVPYNQAYAKWLEPASKLVQEASDLVDNASLKKYLSSRAAAFLSNDYIESDIAWLNIKDSVIDVTIGPYEVYEDEILNMKAAFESFLCLTDQAGSAAIQLFADQLQELEDHLPCDDKYKNKQIVQGKPIVVVDEIGIGGDRGGPQTAAFNLPNDERVTSKHGNKLVILRNVQQAKFDKVLSPIADICIDPKQRELVTFDAFFNHILCHEMCHSLGPHELDAEKTKNAHKTVRAALGKYHSGIEEAKADIAGLYSLLYLIEKGLFKSCTREQVLVSFLASCFRSIRFGLNEAHGKGIAIQLNWIMENKGFVYDEESGCFRVDFEKVEKGITSLTKEILEIQGEGDQSAAQKLIEKYAINQECTVNALNKLQQKSVPVDIEPCFEWTGIAK